MQQSFWILAVSAVHFCCSWYHRSNDWNYYRFDQDQNSCRWIVWYERDKHLYACSRSLSWKDHSINRQRDFWTLCKCKAPKDSWPSGLLTKPKIRSFVVTVRCKGITLTSSKHLSESRAQQVSNQSSGSPIELWGCKSIAELVSSVWAREHPQQDDLWCNESRSLTPDQTKEWVQYC